MAARDFILTTYYFDKATSAFRTRSTTNRLGYHDILIRTVVSGICYTDVHAKKSGKECGLGHEGVGHILEIGAAVKHFQVNDRVGWGWLHSSCGHCKTCVSGYRQYCSQSKGFAFSDLDQGAFSDYRIIDAAFAYSIPSTIPSHIAAPLMCAGASVYEALDAAGTKSSSRVGVVGIGGLGHMAILFAKAMGCAVTAFSQSLNKRADAFSLGADTFRDHQLPDWCHFPHTTEPTSIPESRDIDVLIIASNEVHSLESFFPFLARRATIVLMTIQDQPLTVPYMTFVLPGHRMIASTEASRENHIKMLDFAARHGIKPQIECFEMTVAGLTSAFERLERGEMRYRGVLERREERRASTL